MNDAMQSFFLRFGFHCVCGSHRNSVLRRESSDEKILKRRTKP